MDKEAKVKRQRADYFSNRYWVKLTLGDEFSTAGGRTLRVIKVTPKGLNLLWVERDKCILPSHMYDAKWAGKTIPYHVRTFTVHISDHINNCLFVHGKKLGEDR